MLRFSNFTFVYSLHKFPSLEINKALKIVELSNEIKRLKNENNIKSDKEYNVPFSKNVFNIVIIVMIKDK